MAKYRTAMTTHTITSDCSLSFCSQRERETQTHHSRQKSPCVFVSMFVRFMHVLLTTELRSFSGNGSCTSERGSSGFFSFTLGKTFDCTNELHIQKTELKSTKHKLTTGLKVPKTNNKYSTSSKYL